MKVLTGTLILKLTDRLAVNINFTTAHWRSRFGMPLHGPQVWPWWLLFSLGLVNLQTCSPTTGKRLWVYTRWGAIYFEFILDRRRFIKKRIQGWTRSWKE